MHQKQRRPGRERERKTKQKTIKRYSVDYNKIEQKQKQAYRAKEVCRIENRRCSEKTRKENYKLVISQTEENKVNSGYKRNSNTFRPHFSK